MISDARVVEIGNEEQIDLLALLEILWRYKYLICAITAIFTLAAIVYALSLTQIYRSQVVVTEVTDKGMNGGGALASQLGGIASLAGINLSQAGAGREAKAILKSRRLAEEFITRNNLIPEIFAGAHASTTLWQAVQKFQLGVLDIREDARLGVTTVAIEWSDPVVAARWANDFVALANEFVRARALEESQRNIGYLNEQVAHTNIVELQRVMYGLIEGETKTLMLANGRLEYAFTIIDPAVPSEIRVRPYRTLIALAGMMAGGLIGSIVAFVHNARRRPKSAASMSQ